MAKSSHMKMVNSRVSTASADTAARVLKRSGLTVSEFIRNSLEYVASKGEVPESGFIPVAPSADVEAFRDLIRKLESKPMPGKASFAGLSEDELVERVRMERYGY